tara:strand:- start:384 stop:704 length:321 start_codon:yes stop_codon:yes gene_type:complete
MTYEQHNTLVSDTIKELILDSKNSKYSRLVLEDHKRRILLEINTLEDQTKALTKLLDYIDTNMNNGKNQVAYHKNHIQCKLSDLNTQLDKCKNCPNNKMIILFKGD